MLEVEIQMPKEMERTVNATTETMNTARYFDATSAAYDADFSESSIWAIAHHTGKAILEAALGERRDLAVADIGCGTGKWAHFFAGRTASLLLSDVAESMLTVARPKFANVPKVETLCASVDKLDAVPSATFDLVLCMGDPLSYVHDYRAGIAEVCRIVKPGGLVFVSVDSRLGYLRVLKERENTDMNKIFDFLDTGDIIGWEGLPLHAYTQEELRTLFKAEGCETLSVHSLPTASAYFLFDERFREQIREPQMMRRLIAMEQTLQAEGSPGSHHLYGLFQKSTGNGI